MSRLSWQYVAGLFDGEGNIHVQTGTKGLSAKWSIAQAGKQGERIFSVLKPWLEAQGLKCHLEFTKRDHRRPNWQDLWTLRGNSRPTVIPFLEKIRPYLIIKKVQVEDVLRFFVVFPKLSGCRPGADAKARWAKRILLYGPTGNRCGLYSKQIGKDLKR